VDPDLTAAQVVDNLTRAIFGFSLAVKVTTRPVVILFRHIPTTTLFVRHNVAV
jgi:hypothetical protein